MKDKDNKAVPQLPVTPFRSFPGTPSNIGLHFKDQSLITWSNLGAREAGKYSLLREGHAAG